MRLVIQRVQKAQVVIEKKVASSIERGLLLFLGIHKEDTRHKIAPLVEKLLHLRIFPGENGKMDLSVLQIRGALLVVSQFTLYGECSKGRRPDFFQAAKPPLAEELYAAFLQKLQASLLEVQSGVFGADMQVQLVNDGPVTFTLEG